MTTAAATRPKRTRRRARSAVPAFWLKRFALLPGYDPLAQAGDCTFDPKVAQFACDFFPNELKHAKGPLAGQPFILEPWQQGLVGCMFGWKRPDGTRRYREVFLYIGKKNGKSAIVSGLILLVMKYDEEFGAEIYSAASSHDQAALIFNYASGMVVQSKSLSSIFKVYGGYGGGVGKSIFYPDKMNSYKCLSADADTADGSNVHFAAIDELHRHKKPDLADILQKSTAARSQPLIVYTTTADYNRPSLCNTKLTYAKSVRDNDGDENAVGYDPAFLPVIFEAEADDDWKSPVTWQKANPNMGVTIPESFLARECKKAQEMPTELNNFLRLHLNIVTDSDVAWLDLSQWDSCCLPALAFTDHEAACAGRECVIGLDLSTTTDLTAAVAVFDDGDGGYSVVPHFWMPADTARQHQDVDRVPYLTWAQQGFVHLTPGNVVDYEAVRRFIRDTLGQRYQVREIAFDPWNATGLATQLAGDGFELVQFRQGYVSMSGPSKLLETLVLRGKLNHGGHPVLRWNAGNVTIEQDAAGNIKPNKTKSTGRIDGIIGLVMALGRYQVAPSAGASVYEERGLLVI